MEPVAETFPWSLALTGLASLLVGVLLRAKPGALAGLLAAVGGGRPRGSEGARVPLAFAVAGLLLLTATWGMTWPFAHDARPYAATLATAASLPLGSLVLFGVLLYLTVLRRRAR